MKTERCFYFSVLLLIAFNRLYSQSWQDVGGGVSISPTVPCVYAMAVYKNELYVGGLFGLAGGITVNNIAKWNGTSWSAVGGGTRAGYANGAIGCMAVYNNELFVGGFFDSAGSTKCNRIAKWNGTEWSSVGAGLTGRTSETTGLYKMTVYDYCLVIGGMFYTVDGVTAGNIAKWDGAKWFGIAGGLLNGEGGSVWSLAVHNDSLYVGGDIFGWNIVVLKNDRWQNVGSGIGDYATSLCSFKSELYAGGSRIYNDQNGFMKWDGHSWELVKGPADNEVLEMLAVNNKLYVAGRFSQIGNIQAHMIASWDGQTWDTVGIGFSAAGFFSGVNSLAEYQSYLYAGGNLAGYKNIARYLLPTSDVPKPTNHPNIFQLEQNYPNPFNPTTTIRFTLAYDAEVTLMVFDLLGRIVRTLLDRELTRVGTHEIEFNSNDLPSGIYYYRLFAGSYVETKKMLVLK